MSKLKSFLQGDKSLKTLALLSALVSGSYFPEVLEDLSKLPGALIFLILSFTLLFGKRLEKNAR